MVSLNLPPAPLRKGNIQALDLHHSIGLSAPPRRLYDRAANYGSIIIWKYLKLHIQFSRSARLRLPLPFGAGPLP